LYICDSKHVQDIPKPRELIRRFSTIEQTREFAATLGKNIASDTARERTRRHTPEGRERIRQAKLGDNHPARKNGRSQEFRDKVSKTLTGTRRGIDNPFYGKKHTEETIQKMREIAYKRKPKKWICSEHETKMIPIDDPIPDGFQPGRAYDKYKPI
jgi:hypothetical protein